MSGLEIAGAVLGGFPLLISALEHWRDAYKTAQLLRYYEAEHRKHENDVKDEELQFKLHLELLLRPLVIEGIIDEDALERLLEQPTGSDWQQNKIKDALKTRMPKSFSRYFQLVQEMQEAIFKMIKCLGPEIGASVQACQDKKLLWAKAEYVKAMTDHRFHQLKFSLNQETRKERMDEVRNINGKLKNLLDASDKLSKVQESDNLAVTRKASKSLVQYWKHAGRIHTLFKASWNCPCKKAHCAHLWLQHPRSGKFELKILILWARNQATVAELPPWRQQGLSITWLQGTQPHQPAEMLQAVVPVSVRLPSATDKSEPAKKKKKVSFSVGQSKIVDRSPSVAQDQISTNASPSDPHSTMDVSRICLKEIQSLCKLLESCGMSQSTLGVLTDQNQGQKYQVSSEPEQKLLADEISLKDALKSEGDLRLEPGLPRIQVALNVASAHLQLRSTPWARRQWEAKDILFPQDKTRDNRILFDKPYVSADFNDVLPQAEQTPSTTDRSFGCLGVILLEIWYSYALEEHKIWRQSGLQHYISEPVIRTMVASKWTEELREQAGAEYAAAVEWCLRESPSTLEGTEWRQDLAEKVVMRLERCRDWLKNGDP